MERIHHMTLTNILEQMKEEALFELARKHKVRAYTVIEKEELVSLLGQVILEELPLILAMLSQEDLEQIGEMAQQPAWVITEESKGIESLMTRFGWGRVIKQDERSFLILGEEIKVSCQQLIQDEKFCMKHEKMKLLHTYRDSMLNLYGLVEITWLKSLYNQYIDNDFSLREMMEALEHINSIYGGCKIMGCYLVHESLYCFEEDDFKKFKQIVAKMEYYNPSKEQLIAYADEFYYEPSMGVESVKQYLVETCQLTEQMAHIAAAVLTVHMRIQDQVKPMNMLGMLDEWYRLGIYIGSVQKLEGMMPAILKMQEETRMWCCKGHTPYEMGIELIKGGEHKAIRKVGRNELCPCGSGKKYKKCCMNS